MDNTPECRPARVERNRVRSDDELFKRLLKKSKVLDDYPDRPLRNEAAARSLQRWAAAEREAWLTAVTFDPLLPERLLPAGYMGRRAWQRRIGVLYQAARQLQQFKN